jgi:hypothetical protein
MPSLFKFIRQDLRGALVASLLVLGHGLLLTAAKARKSCFRTILARLELMLQPKNHVQTN